MPYTCDIIENLLALPVPQIIHDAIYDNREEYVRAQKEQMLAGKRKDGTGIGKYRSKEYASRRRNEAGRSGNVILFDTGSFQSQIFVDVRADILFPYSTDTKADTLLDRYGSNIFGIGTTYLNGFRSVVYGSFISSSRKEIFK